MTPPRPPWWFGASVLTLSLALNYPLITAWTRDPSNRFGAAAFLLWIAACATLSFRHPHPRTPVWIASLALLALGQAGSLQVLKQASLALIVPSAIPGRLPPVLLLAAAASWTPAWGWVFRNLSGLSLDPARPVAVAILALAAFLTLASSRRSPSP